MFQINNSFLPNLWRSKVFQVKIENCMNNVRDGYFILSVIHLNWNLKWHFSWYSGIYTFAFSSLSFLNLEHKRKTRVSAYQTEIGSQTKSFLKQVRFVVIYIFERIFKHVAKKKNIKCNKLGFCYLSSFFVCLVRCRMTCKSVLMHFWEPCASFSGSLDISNLKFGTKSNNFWLRVEEELNWNFMKLCRLLMWGWAKRFQKNPLFERNSHESSIGKPITLPAKQTQEENGQIFSENSFTAIFCVFSYPIIPNGFILCR